ncbi:hypothetical protein [Pinibacter aurantiacus]|uniref:Uncharacterized protein n=1 Tax=Pinibacter aurantiacus TaxID=2851599 RepID=A0A9E2SBD0_9BACT|nr:hypothetical protein [Pinibacter aurantiacus]MBV4358079.1 hypothetical protein [Pinibacter aurantiacus]
MDINNHNTNNNLPSDTSKAEKKLLIPKTDEERLREDICRSDMEKFLLFSRMLKRNVMIKRAKITHKD